MYGFSGDNRNRTDDWMLAKHPLYQLSYVPRLEADSNRYGEDLQSCCPTLGPSSPATGNSLGVLIDSFDTSVARIPRIRSAGAVLGETALTAGTFMLWMSGVAI